MSVLSEFLLFIKSGKTSGNRNILSDFVILFFIMLVVRFAIILIKALILGENLSDFSEEQDQFTFPMVLSFVIFLPLFEEIVFRGFLGLPKNKINTFFIGIAAIIGLLIIVKESEIVYPALFIVLLFGFAYLRIESFQNKVDNFIVRYYHILVIISVFLFAGIHITNYDDYSPGTFVAIVPRVISGFYLSFIVTKYSIWHSWLMHSVNNMIPFLFLLFA